MQHFGAPMTMDTSLRRSQKQTRARSRALLRWAKEHKAKHPRGTEGTVSVITSTGTSVRDVTCNAQYNAIVGF